MLRRALFLDRDGVINFDYGYVYQQENFDFIDGVFDLVAAAKKLNYLVVIVTNQAGIGRGYYSESDFYQLMAWVGLQFESNSGAIDAVYFCPNHPVHGKGKYRLESACRKPAPGMILQARDELKIDLAESVLIGDKVSDIEAGLAAGVGKLFYLTQEDNGASHAVSIKTLSESVGSLAG